MGSDYGNSIEMPGDIGDSQGFNLEVGDLKLPAGSTKKEGPAQQYNQLAALFQEHPVEALINQQLALHLNPAQSGINPNHASKDPLRPLSQVVEYGLELMGLVNGKLSVKDLQLSGGFKIFLENYKRGYPASSASDEKKFLGDFVQKNKESIALVNALYKVSHGEINNLSQKIIDQLTGKEIKKYVKEDFSLDSLTNMIQEPASYEILKKGLFARQSNLSDWMSKNPDHIVSMISQEYQKELKSFNDVEVTNKLVETFTHFKGEIRLSAYKENLKKFDAATPKEWIASTRGLLNGKFNLPVNQINSENIVKIAEELGAFLEGMIKNIGAGKNNIDKAKENIDKICPCFESGNFSKQNMEYSILIAKSNPTLLQKGDMKSLLDSYHAFRDLRVIEKNAMNLLKETPPEGIKSLKENLTHAYNMIFSIKKAISGDKKINEQLISLMTEARSQGTSLSEIHKNEKDLLDVKNIWFHQEGEVKPLQKYIGRLLKGTSLENEITVPHEGHRLSISRLFAKVKSVSER